MNRSLVSQLRLLRSALLTLPATGAKGFEGLISASLKEIAGVPFRLASSGSQYGIDGKPTYPSDEVFFEAKRYDGRVPRSEAISKVAELSLKGGMADLWVLGTTSHVGSQLADDLQTLGRKDGIEVLILDWSTTTLPPFAVALAMGNQEVVEFLAHHVPRKRDQRAAIAALDAVRTAPDFDMHRDRIRAQVTGPTNGDALARRANSAWLLETFSSRSRAKKRFGQPLCPADIESSAVWPRTCAIDGLKPLFTCADGTVACILGGEGNGKSWAVAQSWLALDEKPLMIVMNPDDFGEVARHGEIEDLLARSLLKQTGDSVTEPKMLRWRRRFAHWRTSHSSNTVRIAVVIDGINQRPASDWARVIERFSEELDALGGRLIITSRTPYFRARIKPRLDVSVKEVVISEWSHSERDGILAARGIYVGDLNPPVAASLCNPRLLGIAMELLSKEEIATLEELSVSRLLFEHMRINERDALEPQPIVEFARRLRSHAQDILDRIHAKKQSDLHVFMNDLPAVADGRFFQEVENDPTRYTLNKDGLTLALGFAVIDRLRSALRNGEELDTELDAILEPIAALDDTAGVVLAALTVAVVDPSHEQTLTSALAQGFITLQNPNSLHFDAFAALVRKRPTPFMVAARSLALADGGQPNFDWLQDALLLASNDRFAWLQIAELVPTWLSVYSLSPDRKVFDRASGPSEAQLNKRRSQISESLVRLAACEKRILGRLLLTDGDIDGLSRLAIHLLAGKPLAPFSDALINWAFANCLNGGFDVPQKEFDHLLQLNCIDWVDTRTALLDALEPLRGDVSSIGKWTLVVLLRGMGQSLDGLEAEALAHELARDRYLPEGVQVVNGYCTTDPCDPESKCPENIASTSTKLRTLDVSRLRVRMGLNEVDHFFFLARTGLARFSPEIVIEKHREFAENVLSRAGFALRQGLLELRDHTALLTPAFADRLVAKRSQIPVMLGADGLTRKDVQLVLQYLLLLAFPFLSGERQIEALLATEHEENILLDLMDLMKPIDQQIVAEFLKRAIEERSERKQYLLLDLVRCTLESLAPSIIENVSCLLQSKSEGVRAQALGVVADCRDERLLRQVVASGWSASAVSTENGYEVWYGSAALLEAASRGMLSNHEALDRILPSLYGRAVKLLPSAACDIANRIDISIRHVLSISEDLVGPELELQIRSKPTSQPSLFKVGDPPGRSESLDEQLKQFFADDNQAFEQKQIRNHDAFEVFRKALKAAGAGIVVNHFSLDEFEALVAAVGNENYARRWHSMFMTVPETKLPAVHNIALLLAYTLQASEPQMARQLYRRLRGNKPIVRIVHLESKLELDTLSVWSGLGGEVINQLRASRLDCAATDYDLSVEVLAALICGHNDLLASYVKRKLEREEPAEIARGLMVVGFSERSDFNSQSLARFEGSGGLVGAAQKAAKYAYERNVWAEHWFECMCAADAATDFWRFGILFLKVVDGRYDLWGSKSAKRAEPITSFCQAVEAQLKNRIGHWESDRKKKLFGRDAPSRRFVRGDA